MNSNPSRTSEQIQEWMVNYIAQHLNIPPQQIDVTVPFDDFALDSATAIAMTGELEEWLGQQVDPTLVYDYPSISELADYLGQGPSAAAGQV